MTVGVDRIVARPSVSVAKISSVDLSTPGRLRRFSPTLAVSFAVVAAGLGLRLWHLGADRLGFDEAFTAMAGRRPLGDLLHYLRVRDSHPPLDYVLRSPLVRADLSEFWLRVPSVACSATAVLLVAWWLRRHGAVGVLATAFMAVSAFELAHGRDARMYADLELLGVVCAMVSEAWVVRPRRRHAVAIGGLVAVGLLLHTSMFLFGAGLLALPGRRRDADAWRWRGALLAGLGVWAVVWGPAFLQQSRGGHSEWIPRTTLPRAIDAFSRLLVYDPRLHLAIVVGVIVGAVAMWRCDPRLARVVTCCSFVPIGLAALVGMVEPVLLDRTLTLMAWGPMVALAFVVRAAPRRPVVRALGRVAIVALVVVMTAAAWQTVSSRSTPDRVLRHLGHVVQAGDVVALRPGGRLHLLEWSLGVRAGERFRVEPLPGFPDTAALGLGASTASSGRLWLVDWANRHLSAMPGPRCSPDWSLAGARVSCLRAVSAVHPPTP